MEKLQLLSCLLEVQLRRDDGDGDDSDDVRDAFHVIYYCNFAYHYDSCLITTRFFRIYEGI